VAPTMDALAADGFEFIQSKVLQHLGDGRINGA
jgi:hypothetical protein